MLGAVFAALSAASFGLNNNLTRRGVLTGSVAQAQAIGVPIGVPMFFLFALISGGLGAITTFSHDALLIMAATGVLHFICGRYCNYRSVKAMGANLSGPVVQLSLIVSLLLAVTVLQEGLTPLRVLGIALVILGPLLMHGSEPAPAAGVDAVAAAGGRSMAAGPPPFQPRYAEGYLFGLLAAACYGVSPILIRSVVERGGLADSMAAGLVSYCAATTVIALMMVWPGQLRHVLSIDRVPAKWFLAAGVMVTISQMFFYLALATAPVSVVLPILQLHLVFRYVIGRGLNPHHEVVGRKMMAATVLSVAGATALALDPEFMIAQLSQHMTLPEPLVAMLRWRLL
ncbi:MAG TPA: DMT family transporter [Xanthobacteraceae bacterium]|nr:DMT family transporter [Xanthobacteraceae bacterium]